MIESINIQCSQCGTITTVHHIEFHALKCSGCKDFINREDFTLTDYQTDISPEQQDENDIPINLNPN